MFIYHQMEKDIMELQNKNQNIDGEKTEKDIKITNILVVLLINTVGITLRIKYYFMT